MDPRRQGVDVGAKAEIYGLLRGFVQRGGGVVAEPAALDDARGDREHVLDGAAQGHAHDVVRAFHAFHRDPKAAAVYNLGGGRDSNVSMLEAIEQCQQIAGRELGWTLSDVNRTGDHRWWISDLAAFRADYPQWALTFGIEDVLRDIYERNVEQWTTSAAGAAVNGDRQ